MSFFDSLSDKAVEFEFEECEKKMLSYKTCPVCLVECEEKGSEIICPTCFEVRPYEYEYEVYSKTIEQNHNTNGNEFQNFVIYGKNVRALNLSLKESSEDHFLKKEHDWREKLELKLGNNIEHFPLKIINKAFAIFNQISIARIVYRNAGTWYLLGSCIHYAFLEEGIPFREKTICRYLGLVERKLSANINCLEIYNDKGIISIETDSLPLPVHMKSFLARLNISEDYSDFLCSIILRAEKKYLHVKNENRPNSRCVGAIYLLCQMEPKLAKITKEVISEKCEISKTTFLRYYKLLINNLHFIEKCFKKYYITIPDKFSKNIKAEKKKVNSRKVDGRNIYDYLGL